MSMYKDEEWRDVVGFEGLYLVSNYGRVRRAKKCRGTDSHILAQCLSAKGYVMYKLYRKQKGYWKTAHRLVAEAFIPRVEGKDLVNHIDGNKLNNHVSNLEWVTPGENVRHAIATGLLVPRPTKHAIEMAHKAKQRPIVRSDGKKYESIKEAAGDVGVANASIFYALKHGTKSAGWKWRYLQCRNS